MDHPSAGVKATIIDLGLSRMDDGEDDTHWTPFDEEIFEGEGDYQFDVYRLMRQNNGNNWEAFRPLTNVLWLHYLTLKLLNSKHLRPPSASRKSAAPAALGYSERECYECLLEMESLLATSVDALKKAAAPRKGRRRTQASGHAAAAGPQHAGDVLECGVERGWVNAS
ncbi:hypothetical protein EWM64_g948 [Hericium alpestre]|uniref:non-specific serine/threonine protein kinase n=1 Tax=Hericium alpestre TaxID=135208 RepID=A0A4Z0A7L8_9AGAM|nr:hypothetical protein EWM64_g948 [Hericium alpestre]